MNSLKFNNLWKIFFQQIVEHAVIIYIMETLETGYILTWTPPTAETGSIIWEYDSLNHGRTKGEGGLSQYRQNKWGGGVKEYGGIGLCL